MGAGPVRARDAAVTGEGGGTPIRVMLVEDQANFRRLMTTMLSRQADLELVGEAGSLTEARKLADTVSFDVAVLDFGLPDGDGADLIAELRRANPGVRVLILSASLDPRNFAKARDAGADEIMDKLFALDEVLGSVRRLAGV
jgi:DNA-binding NarL/FixJ family response regulator